METPRLDPTPRFPEGRGRPFATAAHVGLRSLALASLAVWVGGFTFYSAGVLPVLHEEWGTLDVGLSITPRVTDRLNAFGVMVVPLWIALTIVERTFRPRGLVRLRSALVVVMAAVLIALVALHEAMDARLATGSLDGFYPWHRAYLILSTLHWLVQVGVLLLTPAIHRDEPDQFPINPSRS